MYGEEIQVSFKGDGKNSGEKDVLGRKEGGKEDKEIIPLQSPP